MNYITTLSEWLHVELEKALDGDAIVFPLAIKKEVDGAYVLCDDFDLQREVTKDGTQPVSISARVLIVDKSLTTAEELADTVEAVLLNGIVPGMGDIEVTSRRPDFDTATGEYVEEIRLTINL